MKITDLKVGDIVKTRDGNGHIILSNDISPNGLSLYSAASSGCSAYLSSYDENMNHKLNKTHDIIAVYKTSEPNKDYAYQLTKDIIEYTGIFNGYNIKWDWERNEKKKMTVSEIEKILGYGVEIVSEN